MFPQSDDAIETASATTGSKFHLKNESSFRLDIVVAKKDEIKFYRPEPLWLLQASSDWLSYHLSIF